MSMTATGTLCALKTISAPLGWEARPAPLRFVDHRVQIDRLPIERTTQCTGNAAGTSPPLVQAAAGGGGGILRVKRQQDDLVASRRPSFSMASP